MLEHGTELDRLTDAGSVWGFALDVFKVHGLPYAIYILSDGDRRSLELRTNIPQLYSATDPAQDPFLDYCCHSYDATRTGIAYLPDYEYLPHSAQAFIKGAERVGFRSGFGIPVRLEGSSRLGGFNLGTPLDRDAFEAEFAGKLPALQSFCLLVHRRLDELTAEQHRFPDDLSPREREILSLICNGASRKETANTLGLSPNTVAEYTKSAYRKLGVGNRAQAARMIFGS